MHNIISFGRSDERSLVGYIISYCVVVGILAVLWPIHTIAVGCPIFSFIFHQISIVLCHRYLWLSHVAFSTVPKLADGYYVEMRARIKFKQEEQH